MYLSTRAYRIVIHFWYKEAADRHIREAPVAQASGAFFMFGAFCKDGTLSGLLQWPRKHHVSTGVMDYGTNTAHRKLGQR